MNRRSFFKVAAVGTGVAVVATAVEIGKHFTPEAKTLTIDKDVVINGAVTLNSQTAKKDVLVVNGLPKPYESEIIAQMNTVCFKAQRLRVEG